MPRINLQTPDGQAYEAELTADHMTVGRVDGNDVVIPEDSVSSSHGQFTNEGGQWVFTDLGSTNGTKVNGERVERVEMAHGGSFEIGNVTATFYEDAAAPVPARQGGTAPRTSSAGSGGYGSSAIERSARVGFGPKAKKKDGPRTLLMVLGVVSLLAALGVAAMIYTGGLN